MRRAANLACHRSWSNQRGHPHSAHRLPGPRSYPGLSYSSRVPHPAGLRCPLPPRKGKWGEGQAASQTPTPQNITHLSSQVMQGAKDFADYLSGEAGAAAPLQAPVTDGRATRLSGSSHDTFWGCPRQHQSALTTHPSLIASVAPRWCQSTASLLDQGFEDPLCDWQAPAPIRFRWGQRTDDCRPTWDWPHFPWRLESVSKEG